MDRQRRNEKQPHAGDLVPHEASSGCYVEYMIGMLGALVDDRRCRSRSHDSHAKRRPHTARRRGATTPNKAALATDRIAQDASADERRLASAAFDRYMRRQGLVPLAPEY